jgi:DNA-binding transcriptional MerR regulator
MSIPNSLDYHADNAPDQAGLMAGQSGAAADDSGKAPDALRTIGEVAKALGIRQHVLRYWEEQFPMLRPLKRSGGRRYYRPEDVQLVQTIDRLVHREGYTLKGAKQVLRGGAGQAAKAAPPAEPTMADTQPVTPPTAVIDRAQLIALRSALAAALHRS